MALPGSLVWHWLIYKDPIFSMNSDFTIFRKHFDKYLNIRELKIGAHMGSKIF